MGSLRARTLDVKQKYADLLAADVNRQPKICVVVPYYEAGAELIESLESLKLEHDDLILVVDDGSAMEPAAEICPDSIRRTPIKIVTLPKNLGITGALQAGMDAVPAEYSFIGRLDCGDVAAPSRFKKQRDYLVSNPSCVVVGSWVNFVDPTGKRLYTEKLPSSSELVRKYMKINSALCHPAVLFRRAAYFAVGGYSHAYPAAEDYALFRLMAEVFSAANLEEVLVTCRTSDGGISERRRVRQILTRMKVMTEYWQWDLMTMYGLARSAALLLTPRRLTTFLKGMRKDLH